MWIGRGDLDRAVERGIIGPEQAGALWAMFAERAVARFRIDVAHVAWYGGALIVIASMTVFMVEVWDTFGGGTLALIAMLYGLAYLAAGHWMVRRPGLAVPGGLLIAAAVSMTPLAAYGVQKALGWWAGVDIWPYLDLRGWLREGTGMAEIATATVGAIAFAAYRFRFLVVPVAAAVWFLVFDATAMLTPEAFGVPWDIASAVAASVFYAVYRAPFWVAVVAAALWAFSMDLPALLFGEAALDFDVRAWGSLGFGLAMLPVAWIADVRGRTRIAFWLHLVGLVAFWGALVWLMSDTEPLWAGFAAINLGLVVLATFFKRRAYLLFGGLGVFGYLGHLAIEVFADWLYFPPLVGALGLGVIALGVVWYRRRAALEAWLEVRLPRWAERLRPAHARRLSAGPS